MHCVVMMLTCKVYITHSGMYVITLHWIGFKQAYALNIWNMFSRKTDFIIYVHFSVTENISYFLMVCYV